VSGLLRVTRNGRTWASALEEDLLADLRRCCGADRVSSALEIRPANPPDLARIRFREKQGAMTEWVLPDLPRNLGLLGFTLPRSAHGDPEWIPGSLLTALVMEGCLDWQSATARMPLRGILDSVACKYDRMLKTAKAGVEETVRTVRDRLEADLREAENPVDFLDDVFVKGLFSRVLNPRDASTPCVSGGILLFMTAHPDLLETWMRAKGEDPQKDGTPAPEPGSIFWYPFTNWYYERRRFVSLETLDFVDRGLGRFLLDLLAEEERTPYTYETLLSYSREDRVNTCRVMDAYLAAAGRGDGLLSAAAALRAARALRPGGEPPDGTEPLL
jgi:hypothetical protein